MKSIKEKITIPNIIILFILMQPIIDIITSLGIEYSGASITIGICLRTLFMAFVVILGIMKSKKKYKIGMFIYYGMLLLYMGGFLLNSYLEYGNNMLFTQIKGLIKNFYLPILIVAFIPIFNEYKINIENKILKITLMIYVITIFLSSIMGIAFPTYKLGDKAGTVGLFYSANEIGAILCILSAFLLVDFIDKKLKIYDYISIVLLAYSILQIGTKVPYFSLIILTLCIIGICIIGVKKKRYLIKKSGMFLGFLIAVYLVSGLTPVGNNLRKIYGDVFLITPEMFQKEVEAPKQEVKIESIEELKTVSVSGRNDFLKKNKEKFIDSGIKSKLIGIGYIDEEEGKIKELKLTEMDYYDILFCTGIIGTILFLIPVLGFILFTIRNTVKNKSKLKLEYIYSIVMSAIVALLAGHVLVSPAVCIYIAIILLKYNLEIEDSTTKSNEINNKEEKRNNEENNNFSFAFGNRRN